jgi:hypothetical protein
VSDRLKRSEGKNFSLLSFFPPHQTNQTLEKTVTKVKRKTQKKKKKLAHRQTHIGTLGKIELRIKE